MQYTLNEYIVLKCAKLKHFLYCQCFIDINFTYMKSAPQEMLSVIFAYITLIIYI